MLGVVNPEGLARADRERLRNSDEEDDCLRSVLVNYLSLAVVLQIGAIKRSKFG